MTAWAAWMFVNIASQVVRSRRRMVLLKNGCESIGNGILSLMSLGFENKSLCGECQIKSKLRTAFGYDFFLTNGSGSSSNKLTSGLIFQQLVNINIIIRCISNAPNASLLLPTLDRTCAAGAVQWR